MQNYTINRLEHFTSPEQYFLHNIEVRSYEVDFNQKLRVTSLFNYLQEIAWEHAENLDFGWDDLNKKGYFWALSRIEVQIFNLPSWTQKVALITWPREANGIFAQRDFEMYDSDGNRLVAATSSWLVVNVNNRRPVRIAEWYSNHNFAKHSALDHMATKIAHTDIMPAFTEQLKVRVGDIDMNQHVNNVSYIDWAHNSFSIDHYKHFAPQKVVVNFNAEGKFNDNIDIAQFQIDSNRHIVCVNRCVDEKNLCKLEFFWQPIQ